MDGLESLRKKFKNYQESGGKTTRERSTSVNKITTPKNGEETAIRLMKWPDGEIVHELDVHFGLNPRGENGWDQPFLDNKRMYGQDNPINEMANYLYWYRQDEEGNEIPPTVDESGKKVTADKKYAVASFQDQAKKLWSNKRYVFLALLRGQEELGPLPFPTTEKGYEEMAGLLLKDDPDFEEQGGFISDDKCLDIILSGREVGTQNRKFTMLSVSAGRKSKPLLPKDCPLSVEQIKDMAPDPLEPYARYSTEELQQILDNFMSKKETPSLKPDLKKYSSKIDEKFNQLSEKMNEN